METGWVEQYENIHTVLYTGLTGTYGLNSVADILAGNVNPSGHLVDTAAYDAFSSPAAQNYGSYYYFDEDGNITPTPIWTMPKASMSVINIMRPAMKMLS